MGTRLAASIARIGQVLRNQWPRRAAVRRGPPRPLLRYHAGPARVTPASRRPSTPGRRGRTLASLAALRGGRSARNRPIAGSDGATEIGCGTRPVRVTFSPSTAADGLGGESALFFFCVE